MTDGLRARITAWLERSGILADEPTAERLAAVDVDLDRIMENARRALQGQRPILQEPPGSTETAAGPGPAPEADPPAGEVQR